MRTELSAMDQERARFQAVFQSYGTKHYKGHDTTTLLFKQVSCDGRVVADHIWLAETAAFQELKLVKGDVVAFDARVKKYRKGYVNTRIQVNRRKEDFKLSHPTRVVRLEQNLQD